MDNPYSAPESEVGPTLLPKEAGAQPFFINVKVASIIFWIGLAAFSLFNSLAPSILREEIFVKVFAKTAVKALGAIWVMADALSRGWEQKRAYQYMFASMFIPEIGVPIYLVKSRGWKGSAVSAIKFAAYGLVFSCLIVILLKALRAIGLGAAA